MKGFISLPLSIVALTLAPFAWSQDQAATSFIKQAAEINAAEIEMAEVAESRASNEDVKHYAKHLGQEHKLATEKLQQIAQKQNAEVPEEPSKMHKEETERLSKLEGPAFDKAYLDSQVKAHQQAIKKFEQQAKAAQSPEIQRYAQMHLPTLREHLQQAQLLQKQTAGQAKQQGQSKQR